jgi:hypothetical protein
MMWIQIRPKKKPANQLIDPKLYLENLMQAVVAL